jgi:hypothetical protein
LSSHALPETGPLRGVGFKEFEMVPPVIFDGKAARILERAVVGDFYGAGEWQFACLHPYAYDLPPTLARSIK